MSNAAVRRRAAPGVGHGSPPAQRSPLPPIAVALGGWGVAADLVGATESPIWQLFLLGGNLPGPWVVGAFVIGAVAGRSGLQPWSGAVLAAGALVIADGLYYVGLVALGARSTTDAVASAATVWGWVAVVTGVALGAAGAIWARPDRHGERTGAVAMGMVAAVLIAEAIVLARGLDVSDLGRTAYAALDVVVAVSLAAVVARGHRMTFGLTVLVLGLVGAIGAGPALDVIRLAIG